MSSSSSVSDKPIGHQCDLGHKIAVRAQKHPVTNIPDDVKPHAIILIGNAKRNVQPYCDRNKNAVARNEYKKDCSKEAAKLTKETAINHLKTKAPRNVAVVAGGTAIGAGIGVACGIPGGPVGMGVGGAVGGMLGAGFGLTYVTVSTTQKIKVEINHSNGFQKWKAQAIAEKSYPVFKNFIDGDLRFENFFCPLTLDIISVPMKAPDGKTYEKEAIETHIKASTPDFLEYINANPDNPDMRTRSPIRGIDFDEKDLEFDYGYCTDIQMLARTVYREIQADQRKLVAQFGLKSLIQNTQEVMDESYTQLNHAIYMREKRAGKSDKDSLKIAQKESVQYDFYGHK